MLLKSLNLELFNDTEIMKNGQLIKRYDKNKQKMIKIYRGGLKLRDKGQKLRDKGAKVTGQGAKVTGQVKILIFFTNNYLRRWK